MTKFKISLFKFLTIFTLILIVGPIQVSSKCTCESQEEDGNRSEALKYKLVSIVSILLASALGVSLPFLVKRVRFLNPEKDIYFLIKALAAGVILATGFIHVLPDAYQSLNSPCLSENPWGKFPFTGFVAMVSAIGTLLMEAFATGYQKRSELRKAQPLNADEEESDEAHAGHVHGSISVLDESNSSDLIRHRIISQVNLNYGHFLFFSFFDNYNNEKDDLYPSCSPYIKKRIETITMAFMTPAFYFLIR